MVEDMLIELARSAWALPLLLLLVLGDAFLVVIPGEAAVTALGARAVSLGEPALAAIVLVAATAALVGDVTCYVVGRTVALRRWRWSRSSRAQTAFAWARLRLERRAALVLFTARFIPFARLAVNLTAGATRLSAPRYLVVAGLAALAWALYQSLVGALVATLVPGGPVVAVVVSVAVAVSLGLAVDAMLALRARARRAATSGEE